LFWISNGRRLTTTKWRGESGWCQVRDRGSRGLHDGATEDISQELAGMWRREHEMPACIEREEGRGGGEKERRTQGIWEVGRTWAWWRLMGRVPWAASIIVRS
jgi:hypothetical protein